MDQSGKLSVRHFLYTKLAKEFPPGKTKKYPVYTRVTLDKRQTDFKSNFQFFVGSKNERKSEELKLMSYLTHKEFDSLYENHKTEIGKAIEIERSTVWEISDLLRQLDVNIVQKGSRDIIDLCMKPVHAALNETCRSFFSLAIYKSQGENNSLHTVIDWSSEFTVLYSALASVAKESFLKEVVLKFKIAHDLFSYLVEFEAIIMKNHNFNFQVMCYQWRYLNLERDFKAFLQKKGLGHSVIDESVSIVEYSLNKFFETLDNKKIAGSMFPVPKHKPTLILH